MMSVYMSQLSNHLWQSTLFAVAAGLLALALRRHRAQTRYWLWLAASFKFLVPFSFLVGIGNQLNLPYRTPGATPNPPRYSVLIEGVLAPAQTILAAAPPTRERSNGQSTSIVLFGAWAFGFTGVVFSWWREWYRIRVAIKDGTSMPFDTQLKVVSSRTLLEPGVFGIWRPVLMLPEGISDRLTRAEMAAVLAHEMCHIRRWDNLLAAIHMATEALFWFHPLVWWLGSRLVEERERSCDEEVLRLGNAPQIYAESILKVCEFYLGSPLVCVAGVTGSSLKKRIGAIMAHHEIKTLGIFTTVLLAAAGMSALAVPVVIGIFNVFPIQAQSNAPLAFEVASVKPNKSTDWRGAGLQILPGGRFSANNVPLLMLIANAYHLPFQSARLSGGPDWIRSERFDIEAIADKGTIPAGGVRDESIRLMLQTLLAERFKLVMRRETKEQPVYALMVGKNGPKLQSATIEEKDCVGGIAPLTAGVTCHSFSGGMGRGLHAKAINMSDIAFAVSNWTDRPVIDKTGLTGLFEIDTEGWASMRPRQGSAVENPEAATLADPTRPTLFAIFDKLGLKLKTEKAALDMYVIDHVSRPTEN